ncbi:MULTISPECIES: MoxR family ATPase [unclassified Nostoc]|uniref:AAA family ATPase n=1 Tax=unclassified Nostoc TaxID=2593658 RepID=UPI002AD28040|nr:MoxR family ATPase [Nostoc sp. DedQUE03]MDZ7971789.1 MoxR family ATPase [Nostoc sp. DedQUE03]MDZ8049028.1 MoxR family ATPase [Nostoc sp. DedQUE02]
MVKAVGGKLLEYTGKVQPQLGERGVNGQLLYPYLPNPQLVEAVNLAIFLERPLLLKGEPGCGKTQLASAVAYELGLNLEAWYVKSTSRARDGLYNYDAVGRLRDAQLAASNRLTAEQIQRIDDPATYVRWGPLGRSFQQENRTVVLIDEIDKADIDFPNDLLLELDERRFIVEETGQEIEAKAAPIVLITSNDEKDLPDAFLRRCLFHYVEFPSRERLIQIVNALFPTSPQALVDKAIVRFLLLREEMRKDKGEAGKKVSTSELIDWFRVLRRYPQDEALAKLDGKIPYAGVLLKSWDDHIRYLRQSRGRE